MTLYSISKESFPQVKRFHGADDGNRAQPDEMRTRFYEGLNSRGVHHCGMFCRVLQERRGCGLGHVLRVLPNSQEQNEWLRAPSEDGSSSEKEDVRGPSRDSE